MKRALFLIFLGVTFLVSAEELNKIIAKVNNEAVTLEDLNMYSNKVTVDEDLPNTNLRQRILERLIQEKLILQVAKKEGLEVPSDWVKTKMDQIISLYESYDDFEKALVEDGLNINILKKKIEDDFLVRKAVEKYVTAYIRISPKEITDYYNSHIDEYKSLATYICCIAKSNKRPFLDKLAEQIKEEGLEKVVQENKNIFFDIESDEEGLKEEVKEVVKNIKEDEFKISEIEGAYYLIYLKGTIPPHNKFLNEVKDEIQSYLWGEKFEVRFQGWIEELKGKAVIKIYE